MSSKDELCVLTFDGFELWQVRLFEKFGWMMLAKSRLTSTSSAEHVKFTSMKLNVYLSEIKYFDVAAKEKLKTAEGADLKKDLDILIKTNAFLLETATKNLTMEMKGGASAKKTSRKASRKSSKSKKTVKK